MVLALGAVDFDAGRAGRAWEGEGEQHVRREGSTVSPKSKWAPRAKQPLTEVSSKEFVVKTFFSRSRNILAVPNVTPADLLASGNGGKLGHSDCLSGLSFLDGNGNELAFAAATAVAGGIRALDTEEWDKGEQEEKRTPRTHDGGRPRKPDEDAA